jgi:membrane-associated protease RseP (regulator of RpoE activity)
MAGMFPPVKPGGKARTASTGFFQTMVQDARTVSADTVLVGEEHRTFYNLPVWKRVIIMAGGPFMNLVIATVLFAVVLCGFGIQQVSTTIGSVSECLHPATSTQATCAPDDPAAPGAAAGILPGDRLVSIGGEPVTSWAQATSVIQRSAAKQLTIVVERDGENVSLTATPVLTENYVPDENGQIATDDEGNRLTHKVGMLGITAAYETVPQPVTAVLPAVGANIAAVTNIILHLPQRLVDVANAAFGPDARDPNGPISVVGVGRIAGEITSLNTIPIADRASSLIGLVASVNVALLVFNLVPLMPLTFAVAALLGGMSLLLIYADIVRPVSLF